MSLARAPGVIIGSVVVAIVAGWALWPWARSTDPEDVPKAKPFDVLPWNPANGPPPAAGAPWNNWRVAYNTALGRAVPAGNFPLYNALTVLNCGTIAYLPAHPLAGQNGNIRFYLGAAGGGAAPTLTNYVPAGGNPGGIAVHVMFWAQGAGSDLLSTAGWTMANYKAKCIDTAPFAGAAALNETDLIPVVR